MFSSGEGGGYVAEKAESASGWLFDLSSCACRNGGIEGARLMP